MVACGAQEHCLGVSTHHLHFAGMAPPGKCRAALAESGPVSALLGLCLARVIRIAFLLNGIFCLLGGIGYVLEKVFLAINFGMGGQ